MKQSLDFPQGWNCLELKQILSQRIRNGYSPNCPDVPNGNWILSLGNLTEQGFDPSKAKPAPVHDPKVQDFLLKPGDFLISRSNTLDKVGRSILFRGEIESCSFPDLLMQFRVNESMVASDYLEMYLRSSKARKYIQSRASGTSGSMVKINKKIVEKIPITLPPLKEQKAIADLLSTWDRAIEKTERLIQAKENQFGWLSHELITKRVNKWKKVSIGSFLRESRIPGTNGLVAQKISLKLYGKGVVPKDEKRVGSTSTKYFVRKAGQFMYSKLDFLNGAFGIVPDSLDGFESTLDLPSFDISESIHKEWFLHFLNRPIYYTRQQQLAKGQRKARRVNPSAFLASKIPLPPRDIQQQTAETLSTAEKEIDLLKQLVDKYQTQKRGLMQKLLTGKWRIKPEVIARYKEVAS